jgi:hypothetical protein
VVAGWHGGGREYEMCQQAEIENALLAESLPNLMWILLLNKGMLSHEPKGEKSKTGRKQA